MEETLSRVRCILTEKIDECRAKSIKVRNGLMASRFYGERGLVGVPPPRPVCLLGALGIQACGWEVEAAAILGIGVEQVLLLEAGFEGWDGASHPSVRGMLKEILLADPYYALGREIGQRLEDEEAADHCVL